MTKGGKKMDKSKTVAIRVGVTEEDGKRIKEFAETLGMTSALFVRFAALLYIKEHSND